MEGGTASSGFIQAMMAKESKNPALHEAFNARIAKHNEKISEKQALGDKRVRKGQLTKDYINNHKFQSVDEWDINRMSKATKNLMRQKELSVPQAIKAFYAWLIAEAKQHIPKSGQSESGAPINYRGTFDIEPKFDEWKKDKKVVIKEEKEEPEEEPEHKAREEPKENKKRLPEVEQPKKKEYKAREKPQEDIPEPLEIPDILRPYITAEDERDVLPDLFNRAKIKKLYSTIKKLIPTKRYSRQYFPIVGRIDDLVSEYRPPKTAEQAYGRIIDRFVNSVSREEGRKLRDVFNKHFMDTAPKQMSESLPDLPITKENINTYKPKL